MNTFDRLISRWREHMCSRTGAIRDGRINVNQLETRHDRPRRIRSWTTTSACIRAKARLLSPSTPPPKSTLQTTVYHNALAAVSVATITGRMQREFDNEQCGELQHVSGEIKTLNVTAARRDPIGTAVEYKARGDL